jgi:hypothetical protein
MSAAENGRARGLRAAKNQALFREINERVKDLNESFSTVTKTGDWVCECANDACIERISLTLEEYEAVRSRGASFFVAPNDDHVWPDVESITDRTDRYWVVEKQGAGGRLARDKDPRAAHAD